MKVRHLQVSVKKKVHGCAAWWDALTNLLISKNFQFGVVVILIISTWLSIYVICDSKGFRILQKKRDKNLLKTNVSLLTQSSNTPGPKPKQYSQSSLDTIVCKQLYLRPPSQNPIWLLRLHETFPSVASSRGCHKGILTVCLNYLNNFY